MTFPQSVYGIHNHYANKHENGQTNKAVAGDELIEREHVQRVAAPVARLVQRLFEIWLPDSQEPSVTDSKPHREENTQNVTGECETARHYGVLFVFLVGEIFAAGLLLCP